MTYIYVDCEAQGPVPAMGRLTEFGAVEFKTEQTFHGRIYECTPDPANPAVSKIIGDMIQTPLEVFTDFDQWLRQMVGTHRAVMVSDNPAFDFMWIADGFWTTLNRNPFGHSARRISDFYAGLTGDFTNSQNWKRLRRTRHDHNPVHDAMGNVEAMKRILAGER
jgi:hypothetical protein